MRETENIKVVLALKPDFMGFIFYANSPRYAPDFLSADLLKSFPKSIKKVGVFVNAEENYILEKIKEFDLDMVQLHGNESAEFCKNLKVSGVSIMKAFSIDANFDFKTTSAYANFCDLFLFDTKAEKGYGGHGKKFDWKLLDKYTLDTPFLLAGGIDLYNLKFLNEIKNPAFSGIDVNSKFEEAPGLKDIQKLKLLKKELTGIIQY